MTEQENAALYEFHNANEAVASVETKIRAATAPFLAEQKAALKRLEAATIAVKGVFFTDVEEGTHRRDIGYGCELKCVISQERELDEPAFRNMIPQLYTMGVDPYKIVKYSAKLRVREYKKTPLAARTLIDTAVTTKQGAPEISIEQAKEGAK